MRLLLSTLPVVIAAFVAGVQSSRRDKNAALGKTVYYKNRNVHSTFTVVRVPFTINFDDVAMVDLGAIHRVKDVVVQFGRKEMNTKVTILEDPPFQYPRTCRAITLGKRRVYRCLASGRFVLISSDESATLTYLFIVGADLFTERFIGCFIRSTNSPLNANRNFTSYADVCPGFTFLMIWAGGLYSCSNDSTVFDPTLSTECKVLCFDSYFCSTYDVVAVYYIGLRRTQEISARCLLDQKDCTECNRGLSGLPCDRRVCSVNNGHCGPNPCLHVTGASETFGFCQCLSLTNCPDPCYEPGVCDNQPNSRCVVQSSTTTCVCKEGYLLNRKGKCVAKPKVNQTPAGPTNCTSGETGHACTCSAGYRNVSGVCQDIDECADDDEGELCDFRYSTCRNTPGSYRCPCDSVDPTVAIDENCEDIDECSNYPCGDMGVHCLNLHGSYDCECMHGYEKTENTLGCVDIAECERGLDDCHPHSTCLNLPGSFLCVCNLGFVYRFVRGRGICSDVDECSGNNICDIERSLCVNRLGSYACKCLDGFYEDSPNHCEMNTGKIHEAKEPHKQSILMLTSLVAIVPILLSLGGYWAISHFKGNGPLSEFIFPRDGDLRWANAEVDDQ